MKTISITDIENELAIMGRMMIKSKIRGMSSLKLNIKDDVKRELIRNVIKYNNYHITDDNVINLDVENSEIEHDAETYDEITNEMKHLMKTYFKKEYKEKSIYSLIYLIPNTTELKQFNINLIEQKAKLINDEIEVHIQRDRSNGYRFTTFNITNDTELHFENFDEVIKETVYQLEEKNYIVDIRHMMDEVEFTIYYK